MVAHGMPVAFDVEDVLAFELGCEALFDDELGGEGGFAELRYALAPADLAVFRFDADQSQVAFDTFVVRFRIGHGIGLNFFYFHDSGSFYLGRKDSTRARCRQYLGCWVAAWQVILHMDDLRVNIRREEVI